MLIERSMVRTVLNWTHMLTYTKILKIFYGIKFRIRCAPIGDIIENQNTYYIILIWGRWWRVQLALSIEISFYYISIKSENLNGRLSIHYVNNGLSNLMILVFRSSDLAYSTWSGKINWGCKLDHSAEIRSCKANQKSKVDLQLI